MSSAADPSGEPGPPVIVGIDGSASATHALAWAVAKTETFGPVVPITAFQLPPMIDVLQRAGRGRDQSIHRAAAEARLAVAVDEVDPALRDRAMVIEDHPGAGLCAAARDAALLVVGTRGQTAFAAGLLGSVGSYCATHAPVPVVVVPDAVPTSQPLRNVLVGVDGSDNAEHALRWAIDHTAPDGRVFAVGALPVWGSPGFGVDPPPEVVEKHLRAQVEETVAAVIGDADGGPTVEVRASARDARTALRDLAGARADLLVVGARGRTGIPYLLLGSVSTALVHHPVVPTAVVPAPERGVR